MSAIEVRASLPFMNFANLGNRITSCIVSLFQRKVVAFFYRSEIFEINVAISMIVNRFKFSIFKLLLDSRGYLDRLDDNL